MRQSGLSFNADNDIKEVDQFGFVDLREAMVTNSIPADLKAQEGNFNHIDDPRQLRARPDDVFASLRAERQYGNIVRHERESQSE